MANISIVTQPLSVDVRYALYLPNGAVWTYSDLVPDAYPVSKSQNFFQAAITVPIDLITAARLRLIRPGDDSGIGDEQWAWIRLIGLTGESA